MKLNYKKISVSERKRRFIFCKLVSQQATAVCSYMFLTRPNARSIARELYGIVKNYHDEFFESLF